MRWALEMIWRDIGFAHWRADSESLQRRLPANVILDRFEGQAWLSVVPFRMTAIHLRDLPVMPGFRDVAEVNLRTYVRVGGKAGIWFFSLDAVQPIVVHAARLMTALPYFTARIVSHEDAGTIEYRSERTGRPAAGGRFRADYTPPVAFERARPDSLTAFLHERYRFFARRGNQLVCGEISHEPWTLGATTMDVRENSLGDIIDHPLIGSPALSYFARELRVRARAVEGVGPAS